VKGRPEIESQPLFSFPIILGDRMRLIKIRKRAVYTKIFTTSSYWRQNFGLIKSADIAFAQKKYTGFNFLLAIDK
jgi:hypothetical protein